MTTADYKKSIVSDFESPAWILLESVTERMNEKGIFVDSINGVGKVKDAHDGKQVSVSTVYRHNGTDANVSVKILVDEWDSEHRYHKYADIRIKAGASDKVIDRRIDKVVEALNA